MVCLRAALDELDLAFDLLHKLYADRFGVLAYLSWYPAFDNLRGDPRYGELLRGIGLPQHARVVDGLKTGLRLGIGA